MKSHTRFLPTIPLLHLIILTCLVSDHVRPLCHTHERTALLQFKDSLIINKCVYSDPLAFPKVASWTPKEKDDCCSWDGIACDENNTHVIALHLNGSCLSGFIKPSSSLFRLSHLRTLNLADNEFNGSQIPSQLGHLLELTNLNLSFSGFAGQIPLEISQLSNLSYLDLSLNFLELKRPNFSTLLGNFRNLKHLDLSYVDISSPVPQFLANFSALTSLSLRACGLVGEFPNDIFLLPNLQFLSLEFNENLTGYFPEFQYGNPLRELWLKKTSFFGHIPSSIGNLDSLNVLDAAFCGFFGQVPSSFGKLSKLQVLDLVSNNLSGTVDFNMFLHMKNLTQLRLTENTFSVLISEPSTAGNINANVPKFEILGLGACNLTSFPSFLRYEHRLKILDLGANHIHGQVPKWIWNISLEALTIAGNLFTSLDIDVLPSRSLRILQLSFNSFKGALPIPPPSITLFDISHNELSGEVTPLLFNLTFLAILDLSNNNFSGALPGYSRNFDHNLSNKEVPQKCLFRSQLQMMDLSYNRFQGRLPRSLLTNSMELKVLRLENNHFNDVFPSWLGTLPKLKVLVLRSNHFHGAITRNTATGYDFPSLQIVDLSRNNFSGSLPSDFFTTWPAMKAFDDRNLSYMGSIINLPVLFKGLHVHFRFWYSVTIANKGKDMHYEEVQEVLRAIDLSSNQFQGEIPECIGELQGLQVLNLSNNMLVGSIPPTLSSITQLESLDLSRNKLSGKLPQQLVQLTFLEVFDVSFNRLRGRTPQGSQFSTFDSSSYEGNPGLWGYPLHSLSTPSPTAPFSVPSHSNEDGQESGTWFEVYWVTIVPGFVGGLIFGVAMEQFLAMDKREWFIKALDFVAVIKAKGRKRH